MKVEYAYKFLKKRFKGQYDVRLENDQTSIVLERHNDMVRIDKLPDFNIVNVYRGDGKDLQVYQQLDPITVIIIVQYIEGKL